jgi:hypothetical protein
LDKLTVLGAAQLVTDKPRSYQLAPNSAGTSAETAPSAT